LTLVRVATHAFWSRITQNVRGSRYKQSVIQLLVNRQRT
jgi:hypothetical protein